MDQQRWQRWVMHTATVWEDISDIVKETGIERIDREHQRLIEYLLDMDEVVSRAGGPEFDSEKLKAQTLLFNRFLTALKAHFKTEESLIEKYRLPGEKLQHREHQSILENFDTIFSDFKEGVLSIFHHLRIDILSEMVNHINGIDHQTFLLENFRPTLERATKWEDIREIIKTTGLPFVDKEHQHLTEKIIELKIHLSGINFKITTRSQKEEILSHLKDLFGYSEAHFNHEVVFLKKYHLGEENQKGLHHYFLTEVHDLSRKIRNNRQTDLKEFIAFLLSWWVEHINGTDYAEFHFSKIAGPVFNHSKTSDDFEWLIRKTGIPEVDNEHACLIGLLLQLEKQDDPDTPSVDTKTELGRIAKFVGQHFRHEEKIMAEQNLRGQEIHKEAHAKLLRYVEEAMTHAVSGRSRISPAFLKRIMRWWVEHTNGMDYDTFVLNRPLT